MKRLSVLLVALFLVSGCSTDQKVAETSKTKIPSLHYSVPTSCELDGVIAAFAAQVPGSRYISTKWQPATGTDLAAVYDNNGIACSYGLQSAEVGGTVMWASNLSDVWKVREAQWKRAGQEAIDIKGLDESAAYILKDGSTSADGMHIWGVNLLVGDLWIQLNGTFLHSVDDALPLINAAVKAATA